MLRTDNRFSGQLYRALNPVYARKPLSGQGAEINRGRFNKKGTPTLYTALDPAGALREANQVGSLQPTILVSYDANLGPIFDSRNKKELRRYEMTEKLLADPAWRIRMLDKQIVPTQDFAQNLIADGYVGLLIQSYAKGASAIDLNIVLWHWRGPGRHLQVVDDEDRLSRL